MPVSFAYPFRRNTFKAEITARMALRLNDFDPFRAVISSGLIVHPIAIGFMEVSALLTYVTIVMGC
jgi:hypothetical protein